MVAFILIVAIVVSMGIHGWIGGWLEGSWALLWKLRGQWRGWWEGAGGTKTDICLATFRSLCCKTTLLSISFVVRLAPFHLVGYGFTGVGPAVEAVLVLH